LLFFFMHGLLVITSHRFSAGKGLAKGRFSSLVQSGFGAAINN